MKIFKKIKKWLSKNDTNLAEYYKQRYESMEIRYEMACAQNEAFKQALNEALKTNSELKDEIDI